MVVQTSCDLNLKDINCALARVIFGGFINGTDLTNPQPERYQGYPIKLEALARWDGTEDDQPPRTVGHLLDGREDYLWEIHEKIFSLERSLTPEEYLLHFCKGMIREDSSRFELSKALDEPEAVRRIENLLVQYQIPFIDYLVLVGIHLLDKGCKEKLIIRDREKITYVPKPLE